MRGWTLGALVLSLAAGCTSSAPDSNSSPSTATDNGRPTTAAPAGPATDVARAVLEADSDESRRAAILDVFAGVGIGVYTTTGDAVVVGAERSADDFFAYDFEIDGLSLAMRDGDQASLQDIASGLAAIGLLTPDADSPTRPLVAALTKAVPEAIASPGDASSYALLVARELALGAPEPVDLATLASDEDVLLDPLAGFLIAADVVLPTIAATPPDALAARSRTASLDVADEAMLLAAGPCPTPIQGQGGWRAGRASGQLPNTGAANPGSMAYLQLLLANSIVQVTKQALPGGGLNWHYRHDAGDTEPRGYQLVFKLRVNPSSGAILCGVLAGSTLPQDRILAGVPVLWEYAAFRSHGTADCPAAGCETSDRTGASTFKYLPKLEKDPVGLGPEVSVSGLVRAHWDIGRSLAPELAALIQGASYSSYGWAGNVTYHLPYEVTIELVSDIRIIEALSLFGHVADAHADGHLEVKTAHGSGPAPTGPPCTQRVCVGPVLELDTLNVKTTAATDGPKCPASHVTIDGPAAIVDVGVIDAVIYPAAEISVRLDMGFSTDEKIDVITYVPCGKAPTQTSPPGVSAWEHYMLRSRSFTGGFIFQGLKAGTADGPGWVYVADASVWQNGGTVAIWDAPEGCGGSCDPARSRIRLELKVKPLPPP